MKERLLTLGMVIVVVLIMLAAYSWVTRSAVSGSVDKTKQQIVFRISAPEARFVFVAGSFNGWQTVEYRLKKNSTGVWETSIPIAPGRYEYKFVVDSTWVPDPANPIKVPVPLPFTGYNSFLEVTDSGGDSLTRHQ
jgi:hypothetical protein